MVFLLCTSGITCQSMCPVLWCLFFCNILFLFLKLCIYRYFIMSTKEDLIPVLMFSSWKIPMNFTVTDFNKVWWEVKSPPQKQVDISPGVGPGCEGLLIIEISSTLLHLQIHIEFLNMFHFLNKKVRVLCTLGGGAQLDNMSNDHHQNIITHVIKFFFFFSGGGLPPSVTKTTSTKFIKDDTLLWNKPQPSRKRAEALLCYSNL